MRPIAIILLTIAMAISSCSQRERMNPLDPHNPDTQGAASGLSIFSNRDSVFIRWNPVDVDNLVEYAIYRSQDDTDFEKMISISPEFTEYIDLDIEYDHSYRYTLQIETDYDLSAFSDTLQIVPGPHNLWVADFHGFSVQRISYDGSHRMAIQTFPTPIAFDFITGQNLGFVANYWDKQVSVIDHNINILRNIPLDDWPVDMQIDPADERIFVLLREQNTLDEYSFSGGFQKTTDLDFDVTSHFQFAYDPVSSSIWYLDLWTDSLRVSSSVCTNNLFPVANSLLNAKGIESDPLFGGCWVPAENGLHYFSIADSTRIYKPEYHILDISLNPENGDCYFVAQHNGDGSWQTGRLRGRDGYQEEILLDDAYPRLYSIQAIPGQGKHGFLVFQGDSWKLLRFDEQENLIGEVGYFDVRLDTAIE